MGNYGIKVTKPGYDVSSATALQQVFNSSYNCMKMLPFASFSQTVNGTADVVVTHNLGYKPAFLVFFEVLGNGKWYAYGSDEDSGRAIGIFAFATDTDIVFRLYSNSSTAVIVEYVLFVDPGE